MASILTSFRVFLLVLAILSAVVHANPRSNPRSNPPTPGVLPLDLLGRVYYIDEHGAPRLADELQAGPGQPRFPVLPQPGLIGTPFLRPLGIPGTPHITNAPVYPPSTAPRYPSSPPSTAAFPVSGSAHRAPAPPATSSVRLPPDPPARTTSTQASAPPVTNSCRRGRPSTIADGQSTGAGPSNSARKTPKRKAPEPPVEPSVPAPKRSRLGRPNWRDEEIESMLDIVEEHQPAGQQIEDKFKNLVRKKPPTGNLNIPPLVARALDIDRQISARFSVLEEEDSPDGDLSLAGSGADSDRTYEWTESGDDDEEEESRKESVKGKEKEGHREKGKGKGKEKEKDGKGKTKEKDGRKDKAKGKARAQPSAETVFLGPNPPPAPRATRAPAAPPRRNRRLNPEFLTNVAASFDPSTIAARDHALAGRVEEMSRVSQLERQVERLEDQLERMRTERNVLERERNDFERRLTSMRLERQVLRNAAQNHHHIRYTRLPPRLPSPSSDEESNPWYDRSSARESEGGTIHYADGGMSRRARHVQHARHTQPAGEHPSYRHHRPPHRYQPSPPMRLETRARWLGPFTPPRPIVSPLETPTGRNHSGAGTSRSFSRAPAPSTAVSPRMSQAAEALGQLGVNLETESQNASIHLTISPSKTARPDHHFNDGGHGY